LYVKFKLADEDASMLAWTTTPWSLPGNGAVAVHPDEKYVYVKVKNDEGETETLVLAKKRLEALKGDKPEVVKTVAAGELAGKRYEPLFVVAGLDKLAGADKLYYVQMSESVSIEDGTGVLHVAPAFGEEDLKIGQAAGFPVLSTIDGSGRVGKGVGLDEVAGVFFKDADKAIIEHLAKQGSVYAVDDSFTHTYPFCYRCDSPLLYYAITTWFLAVSSIKDQLLKTAEDISWQPAHIKDGRFGKWLEGARDWAVSRNRYWGAPMPIWMNVDDESDYLVVESLDELVKLAGLDGKPEDVHRPGIDAVVVKRDGKTYKRIEEVFDCWFESGSMPAAQQHYPFENKDVFETSYPADYIGEGLDQTRLWFYVMHVLSTIAFDKPAYRNVLVNGMVMAADGQKLSKRLKNYPPVEDVFATEGADSLRLYLLGNDQAVGGDYMRFNREAMGDIQRNVFGTLWNSYSFLAMYAEIEKWQPKGKLAEPKSENVLDAWMLARLNQTTAEVTAAADAYQLAQAIRPLRELVDDLSNWYVRRSRRRFSRNEDATDKQAAFVTLHYALARIAQLLAPWAPFFADKLWRELTDGMDEAKSVHLSDWPEVRQADGQLLADMATARSVIATALAQRAEQKIKVRQPLASVTVPQLAEALAAMVADEVNVKKVTFGKEVKLDTTITPELKAEGTVRDVIRLVQEARKTAGLRADDRIRLSLSVTGEVRAALETHAEVLKAETLADAVDLDGKPTGEVPARVDGTEVYVSVEKVSK
ncbi:MAG TPA: class I tRNA ligase family protein, partial [Candidatus Saccharimonas sp.]|nr:class I tRNA ligase family protein [Candidatus Saccharimonas sp.]